MKLIGHLHLLPKLRLSTAIRVFSLLCSRGVDRDNFAFYNVKNTPLFDVTTVIPTGSEDFLGYIILSRVLLITVSVLINH